MSPAMSPLPQHLQIVGLNLTSLWPCSSFNPFFIPNGHQPGAWCILIIFLTKDVKWHLCSMLQDLPTGCFPSLIGIWSVQGLQSLEQQVTIMLVDQQLGQADNCVNMILALSMLKRRGKKVDTYSGRLESPIILNPKLYICTHTPTTIALLMGTIFHWKLGLYKKAAQSDFTLAQCHKTV